MAPDGLPDFEPGRGFTRADLVAMVAAARRRARLRVLPPLRLSGRTVELAEARPTWATLAGAGNPYTATEARPTAGGGWAAGTRAFPACYEVNGKAGLGGSVQLLRPTTIPNEWKFQSIRLATGGGTIACNPCAIPDADLTLDASGYSGGSGFGETWSVPGVTTTLRRDGSGSPFGDNTQCWSSDIIALPSGSQVTWRDNFGVTHTYPYVRYWLACGVSQFSGKSALFGEASANSTALASKDSTTWGNGGNDHYGFVFQGPPSATLTHCSPFSLVFTGGANHAGGEGTNTITPA